MNKLVVRIKLEHGQNILLVCNNKPDALDYLRNNPDFYSVGEKDQFVTIYEKQNSFGVPVIFEWAKQI